MFDMDKKILLLDRDNDILGLAHEIMFYGYSDMHITSVPSDIYKIAQHYKPDLVILDYIFARDEFESICQSFKAHKDLQNVPVIIVSTSYNKIVNSATFDADIFLLKPMDNKDFATQIGYLMAS